MSNKQIFWTPIAIDSLKQMEAFLIENWSLDVSNEFLDRIEQRIEQLKQNPEIAPKIENTTYHRLLIHPNVSLFYTIEIDFIKLLLLWDNRQDPKQLKKQLSDAQNQ